jgi:DNA gyrase subunit A
MPTILVLSEKGVGKRSALDTYRITNRNGKGVKTIAVTEKTGKLIAIKKVMLDQDIMIINKSGITIRIAVADIKQSGRLTQGVKIIDIQKRNDVISSVCVVEHEEEEEFNENENLNVNENGTSYENENVNDNENQNENQ